MAERNKMKKNNYLINDVAEEITVPGEETVDMHFLSYLICRYLCKPSDTFFLLKIMMVDASFADIEKEQGYSKDEQIRKMAILQKNKLIEFKIKEGEDHFKFSICSNYSGQDSSRVA